MAIVNTFASPTGFTLHADGRTQTSYSGERSGNPSDTEITAIEIAGTSIPETLMSKIMMGADFAAMGATAGFIVYFNGLKFFATNQTIAISGGIVPEITLVIPRGVDLKITTINDGSSGAVSRWVTVTAWALRSKAFRPVI